MVNLPRSVAPTTEAASVPLALKLGVSTVLILGIASVVVAGELARRERESLVASKRRAIEQVTELFARYDVSALEFADVEATEEDIRGLGETRDVTFAAVWAATGDDPVASVGSTVPPARRPRPVARTTTARESMEVVRPIESRVGDPLGVALVRVSLAPENAAYEASVSRIRGGVVGGALGLAVLLTIAVYFFVAAPLAGLVRATRRIEQGERVAVGSRAKDEVGVLSRAFDRMAHTIVDREDSLRATTTRLQDVLDHMGQAILVFDAQGVVEVERSRQADVLVGRATSIVDVLFPEGSTPVEREAFEVWMGAVFGAEQVMFDSMSDLAPTEAKLRIGVRDHSFRLEFRPVIDSARIERVMLLATDVTEETSLRADVARKDEEHHKRVAAMRRLVAGGGQVFVRFLEGARFRLATSRARVADLRADDRSAVAEIFRHVHTMRGEARCFDLDQMETRLAHIEFELADVRTRRDERYDLDAVKATIDAELGRAEDDLAAAEILFVQQSPVGAAILDQVTVRKTDIAALEALAEGHGDEVAKVAIRIASRPFGESVFLVAESVPRWLAREAKEAELLVEGRDVPVPPDLSRVLPGVLAHLVRNAIAHGIETPELRAEAGKEERALVTLFAELRDDGVAIGVRDDGVGFDEPVLRGKARALGVDDTLPLEDLIGRIGSTRDAANDLAGHGVGLDAVKVELEDIGYRIRIESSPGRGATMWIESAPRRLKNVLRMASGSTADALGRTPGGKGTS